MSEEALNQLLNHVLTLGLGVLIGSLYSYVYFHRLIDDPTSRDKYWSID